jgi:hypothetical protein
LAVLKTYQMPENGDLPGHTEPVFYDAHEFLLAADEAQRMEARRSQDFRERLTKLRDKCVLQNVSNGHWSGPGSGSPDGEDHPTDTIEITLPTACPHLVTATKESNADMKIRPEFKVDGSRILSVLRSSVMPLCFGITCVPTIASSDPHYVDASVLADLADIEITARGTEPCRGMELKASLQFAHSQKLEKVDFTSQNLHPNLRLPSDLIEQNIPEQLHRWTHAATKYGTGWVESSGSVHALSDADASSFDKLQLTLSWCENRETDSGDISLRILPLGGRERALTNRHIISLAICQFDKQTAAFGRSASLAAHLVGLNPRNLRVANHILFCVVQALNQRIAYNPEGQSLAFRCFYFLLFPHTTKDSTLNWWTRGFLDQVLQIFLEKKSDWLPHDAVAKQFLQWLARPYAMRDVCLQNDEIILRLAVRRKEWQRMTINYVHAPERPEYVHPAGIVRGIGRGLWGAQRAARQIASRVKHLAVHRGQ